METPSQKLGSFRVSGKGEGKTPEGLTSPEWVWLDVGNNRAGNPDASGRFPLGSEGLLFAVLSYTSFFLYLGPSEKKLTFR